jgi:hypothetical protein
MGSSNSSLQESRAAIALRSLSIRDQKLLSARVKELFRILVAYPNVALDVKEGGAAVRQMNAIRAEQSRIAEARLQMAADTQESVSLKMELHHRQHDVLRTFLMWTWSAVTSVGLIPIAGRVGWRWPEIALGVPAGFAAETLTHTFDAWKERHEMRMRFKTLERKTSVEREKKLDGEEAELLQQVRGLSVEAQKSLAVTAELYKEGVNPYANDHLTYMPDAIHYREVVDKIGDMLIMNFPDQVQAIFGPLPPKVGPELAEQRMRYAEYVSLRFLHAAIGHGNMRAFDTATQAFETADWTVQDVFEHLDDRILDATNGQLLWARAYRRASTPSNEKGRILPDELDVSMGRDIAEGLYSPFFAA